MTRRFWSAVPWIVVAAACGGQSLDDDHGSGGSASGSAGTPGGGGSPGSGGSPASGGVSGSAGRGQAASAGTGGSSRGGSANVGGTGGTAGTGIPSAGRGGTGVGGSAGSVASGGADPVAGQGGATSDTCSLPLETGPCDAAFVRYGYDPQTLRCEPFSYGGCQGNANNFDTYEACVEACGAAVETGCPSSMPGTGTACSGPAQPCDYSGQTSCLCQPKSQYECVDVAPNCNLALDQIPPGAAGAASACSDPGCIEEVVVISYFTCSCDSTWTCVVGGASGGPR